MILFSLFRIFFGCGDAVLQIAHLVECSFIHHKYSLVEQSVQMNYQMNYFWDRRRLGTKIRNCSQKINSNTKFYINKYFFYKTVNFHSFSFNPKVIAH